MIELEKFKQSIIDHFITVSKDLDGMKSIKTHTTEIVRVFELAMLGLVDHGSRQTHFTSSGILHQFIFLDGKKYQMTLKELEK